MPVTITSNSRTLFDHLVEHSERTAHPRAALSALAEELLAIEENTFAAGRSPNGAAWARRATPGATTAVATEIRALISSGDLFFSGAHQQGHRRGRSRGGRNAGGGRVTLVRTGRLLASRAVRVEGNAIVSEYAAPYAAYVSAGRGPGPHGASRARPILPRSSRSGRGRGPAGVWFRGLADRLAHYVVSGDVGAAGE